MASGCLSYNFIEVNKSPNVNELEATSSGRKTWFDLFGSGTDFLSISCKTTDCSLIKTHKYLESLLQSERRSGKAGLSELFPSIVFGIGRSTLPSESPGIGKKGEKKERRHTRSQRAIFLKKSPVCQFQFLGLSSFFSFEL
jgi:hypothetical protein